MQHQECIATFWKPIAAQIDLSPERIKIIEDNRPNNIEGCYIDMVTYWLRNGNCCWCTFISALVVVGGHKIAGKLNKHFESLCLKLFARLVRKISDQNLPGFVRHLFEDDAADLIEDISDSNDSKEEKVNKICKVVMEKRTQLGLKSTELSRKQNAKNWLKRC